MKKLLFSLLFIFCFITTNLFALDYINKTEKEGNIYYDVFIDQDVFEPAAYRELVLLLQYASSEDTFIFHINTNGGSLFAALEISNAIKYTDAKTVASLYRGFSAGALIAISCEKVLINDFAVMMIHNYSQSLSGNITDIKDASDFFKTSNDNLLEMAFYDFLDNEEIESIKKGKTLWLSEDQIYIRLSAMKKLITQ